jgi:MFS family permease
MRRRIYFLLPNVGSARQVVNELLLARIGDHHIHVMAREGIDLGDLPAANLLQRSDFIHGVEIGLSVGGATGIVAGLIAVAFPPEGIVLGGWTLLAMALAGALIGAWVAGMIGTDIPNSQLREFAAGVAAGQILMMVDVPKSKVAKVTDMIRKHHPEADMHGVEPTMPAFP